MNGKRPRRNVRDMKRWFLFVTVALALLCLALAGWAVQGVRWTLTAPRRRRMRLAAA